MNTLLHADCLDVMKGMPDKSIGCIITDPPYGLNIMAGGKIGKGRSFTIKDWDSRTSDKIYFD